MTRPFTKIFNPHFGLQWQNGMRSRHGELIVFFAGSREPSMKTGSVPGGRAFLDKALRGKQGNIPFAIHRIRPASWNAALMPAPGCAAGKEKSGRNTEEKGKKRQTFLPDAHVVHLSILSYRREWTAWRPAP